MKPAETPVRYVKMPLKDVCSGLYKPTKVMKAAPKMSEWSFKGLQQCVSKRFAMVLYNPAMVMKAAGTLSGKPFKGP